MSRDMEIFEFLRRNLSVQISVDTEYECGREYATSNASIRLRNPETDEWEDISSSYDSVCISSD